MWSFGPPPPPHHQHNVNVDSSKEDLLLQHCFWGRGEKPRKLNDFKMMCHQLVFLVGQVVQRLFGQHCMYPKIKVFLGVRTCEVFVCSLAIVRVGIYYIVC